ncbi:glycosyltransferase family A protein [Pseudoalteromonas espejiana]
MRVLVAVLTTGSRSATFEQCILSILEQSYVSSIELSILIVENNPELSHVVNRSVSKFTNNTKINVIRVLETKQGIPYARNNALNYAQNNQYGYLAFIDDDAYAEKTG